MVLKGAGCWRGQGRFVLLFTTLLFAGGCYKQEQTGVAVKNAAELIDKEAEFAEFSLTKCRQQDAAGCDDVAKRLGQIRTTSADLKALKKEE